MTNLECIEYASKYSFKGLYEKGLRDMLTQIVCEYYNGVGGSFEHYLDELQSYMEVLKSNE